MQNLFISPIDNNNKKKRKEEQVHNHIYIELIK